MAPPAAAGSRLDGRYSWQQVVSIFVEDLGLPGVTDDASAVAQAIAGKKDRYDKMKQHPSGAKQAKADEWFDRTTWLKNHLDSMVATVREEFVLGVDAMLDSGTTQVTPAFLQRLRQMAARTYSAVDELADRWVNGLVAERGWTIGGAAREPALVTDLTAEPGVGTIRLMWQRPAADCDRVVVRRRTGKAQAGSAVSACEVFSGNASDFIDGDVEPGHWYTYDVISVVGASESERSQTVSCLALGEVSDLQAEWTEQGVVLRWSPAEGCEESVVLRDEAQAPPAPARGARGSGGFGAPIGWRGRGGRWCDDDVEEGKTYYYRVIARYDDAWCSDGVVASVGVPRRPPPPGPVSAQFRGRSVLLEWEPAPIGGNAEYVVVRKEGARAPLSPSDGDVISTTRQPAHEDGTVRFGRRYAYTVFTRDDGLTSTSGSRSEPVVTAAEVTDLSVTTGDQSVALEWDVPPGVAEVVVRRSRTKLNGREDGVPVPVLGRSRACDEGLQNGRTYHYLICCRYVLPGGETEFSAGITTPATPEHPPDPLTDFAIGVERGRIVLTYEPVEHGVVSAVRCSEPPGIGFGRHISADRLADLGTVLVRARPGRIVDESPDAAEPHYAVFVVAGKSALAGPVKQCIAARPVTNLRGVPCAGGVRLFWDWPEHCRSVKLARRRGAWPSGPDDPRAEVSPVSLRQYQNAGGYFFDEVSPSPEPYYYVAYARVSRAQDVVFASGETAGERCRLLLVERGRITYSFELVRSLLGLGARRLRIEWECERLPEDFGGLVLVGNAHNVPSAIEDGFELLRWAPRPGGGRAAGRHRREMPLDPGRVPGDPRRLYCKAFLLSEEDRERVVLMDPDVSRPVHLR